MTTIPRPTFTSRDAICAFISTVELKYGSHAPTDAEYCAMELVAFVAGEPHSDTPKCASPVITSFCINLNDNLDDATRNRLLRPVLCEVVGTRTTDADELTRSYLAGTGSFARTRPRGSASRAPRAPNCSRTPKRLSSCRRSSTSRTRRR